MVFYAQHTIEHYSCNVNYDGGNYYDYDCLGQKVQSSLVGL